MADTQSRTQSLLTSLLRMLDENEGLWKEPILSPQIADFRLTAHDRRQNGGRSAKPLNRKALYNIRQNHVSQIAVSGYDHELNPINMAIKV